MNLKAYLDSTYLKTPDQAGLSPSENMDVVRRFVDEAIAEQFKLIMIRPDQVAMAKQMVHAANSKVLVGTVIDFPKGDGGLSAKLIEAEKAIADGADDLDFVCDYQAFKRGETSTVKEEILRCTQLGLSHHKTVKWIIEVAALDAGQIVQLSTLIKNVVVSHFKEEAFDHVFVKSSTGFYVTQDGAPNGATRESIIMMLENACPLPVKAAGGVRTLEEAEEMIRLGVKRIGTSSAKAIAKGHPSSPNAY